jgi:diguanylate cyclase (GGDEF)-like protein
VLQWQMYTLAPLIGAVVSAVVGVLAWRRRAETPAAMALVVVMVGLVWWAGEDTIASLCTDPDVKTALALARFPGTSAAALGFCWLCRSMADRHAMLPRWVLTVLLVEPALMSVAAATNGSHRLVFVDTDVVGYPGLLSIHVGPLFYLHSVYNYLLITVTLVGVARTWRTTSSLHRRQLSTVLIAAVFPVIGNAVTVVQFTSGGGGDYAVLGFVVTGVFTGWAVFRQGLLRLVPVARGLVLERVNDLIVVIDMAGRVLDLNPAASRLVRLIQPDLPAELVGLPAHRLLPQGPDAAPLTDGECSLRAHDRHIDLDIRSSDLADRRGAPIGRVIVARDVTELNDQKRALHAALAERDALEAQLRYQAFHDNLTGLANRALFADRLAEEYARARRYGLTVVAILIDLDDFKPVNDTLGHHAGDLLLQEVAARLTGALRQVDTVARLGGDEFAVLLCQPRHDSVAPVAQRVLDALQQPCMIAGHPVQVRASVGVAIDAEATGDPEHLLGNADAAMYQAKEQGKGSYSVFDPDAGESTVPADSSGTPPWSALAIG